MRASRLIAAAGGLVLLGAAAFAALAWHPAIPPIDPPAAGAFAPELVARGATLAALGNCAGCHTAPGRPAFSGGLPVQTPFGAIYASNISPDPDTGIGRWPEAAFKRAMRDGVDRQGRNLYPAFPYDHYTLVSDADDEALYAYLMTRRPVPSTVPTPALPLPLDIRAVMAGWNLLFFRPGPYRPDAGHDADWNRGAYLVEGLGHCGACHTPHDAFGAEEGRHHLGGGVAEGWNAYALDTSSPAPVPWTVETLAFYLRHGWQAVHGAARGPMAEVTGHLGPVPDADLHAMAVYLVSLMGRPDADALADALALEAQTRKPVPPQSAGSQIAVTDDGADRGAVVYAGACSSCHESGRPLPYGGLPLTLSSALHAPDPSNIVIVTLRGLAAPSGAPGPVMPGFAGALDDADIAALLRYLRADVAREPPWPNLDATIGKVRAEDVSRSTGNGGAPAQIQARVAP